MSQNCNLFISEPDTRRSLVLVIASMSLSTLQAVPLWAEATQIQCTFPSDYQLSKCFPCAWCIQNTPACVACKIEDLASSKYQSQVEPIQVFDDSQTQAGEGLAPCCTAATKKAKPSLRPLPGNVPGGALNRGYITRDRRKDNR